MHVLAYTILELYLFRNSQNRIGILHSLFCPRPVLAPESPRTLAAIVGREPGSGCLPLALYNPSPRLLD